MRTQRPYLSTPPATLWVVEERSNPMEIINQNICLSVEDVHVRYGINVEAVKRLARTCAIPCIRAGTRYLFPLRSLEAYEEELGRRSAQKYVDSELMARRDLK